MDITASSAHPFYLLSNYASHPFIFDGVLVNSMEGFLQSLKLDNEAQQKRVCLMIGLNAKAELEGNDSWQKHQELVWQGRPYRRQGQEYQSLLDRAYCTMMESNPKFAQALKATGTEDLKHSVGTRIKELTPITSREFCCILERLRASLLPDLINDVKPPQIRRLSM